MQKWYLSVACLFLCPITLASFAQTQCVNPKGYPEHQCEVTVSIEMWTYQRVFPLLDGLFQDVEATQLSSLSLGANSSNATSIDAIQQGIQVQAGFNQLAQAQNQASLQMLQANNQSQMQMIQTQSSLLQSLVTAEGALVQADAKQQADGGADAATQAVDTANVTQAQNAVKAIEDNLTQLGSQLKAPAFTPTASTAALANPTVAPTAVPLSSLTPAPSSTGPSFPATKQMDNQVELLWERLARVVSSMVKPDSTRPDDSIYFVHFDFGIFPIDRKNRLLDANFPLQCKGDTTGEQPIVLDMFPKVAAINLTETNYRDRSFSIATALSWLGFGVNSSFNREHLRLSQVLGQSSYITGRGVGQSQFGWRFGISLGDDEISPDTRSTFALISVPKGCTPKLAGESMTWLRRNSKPSDYWWSSRDETPNETNFQENAEARFSAAYNRTTDAEDDLAQGLNRNPYFRKIEVDRAGANINLKLTLREPSAASFNAAKINGANLVGANFQIQAPNVVEMTLDPGAVSSNSFRLELDGTQTIDLANALRYVCPSVLSNSIAYSAALGIDGRPECMQLIQTLASGTTPGPESAIVQSIRYSRPSYPSSGSAPLVTVTLVLKNELDQQTIITADGVLLKRARDVFTRAVSTQSAPTGLLEAAGLTANTWTFLNSRSLLLTLDSSMFGQHFPDIILSSPSGSMDLTTDLTSASLCPELKISGQNIAFPSVPSNGDHTCFHLLTSLTYKTATVHNVSSARVIKGLGGKDAHLILTDLGGTAPSVSAPAAQGVPQLQISSGSTQTVWGEETEVYQINENGSAVRLHCEAPIDTRLKCEIPSETQYDKATYRVLDLNHRVDQNGTVGTLEAWTTAPECDDAGDTKCLVPALWQSDISINTDNTGMEIGWIFTAQLVNLNEGDTITASLGKLKSAPPQITVPSNLKIPLAVKIPISIEDLANLSDDMNLVITTGSGSVLPQRVSVHNLLSHLAPEADAGVDWNNFSGTNLLSGYTSIQIAGGTAHPMECVQETQCTITTGSTDADKNGAIVLLDWNNKPVTLRQYSNGKYPVALFAQKDKTAGSAGGAAGGAVNAGNATTINIGTVQTSTPTGSPQVTTVQTLNPQSPPD